MSGSDRRIAEQTRTLLDEKLAALDAPTLSRLNRRRQRALEQALGPRRYWLPAGLVTAAAALVLAIAVIVRPPAPVEDAAAPFEDLDLLVADESLDMLAELEFYVWLEGELERG